MSGEAVQITRDDLSPLLGRIKDAAIAQGLTLVMARAVGTQVKDHLVALNAERHRSGGRNYYARAARSVTTGAAAGFAYVSINQIGMRLRRYGGKVTAGQNGSGKKYLTIPACQEAYGMRAGEFHDLKFALAMNPSGRLQAALVRRASTAISITRRKQKDGTIKTKVTPGQLNAGGQVMFWLVHSVTHRADPSVLPTHAEMLATALNAGSARIARLQQRATGGAS